MNPKHIDHEWSLYLAFNNEYLFKNFLRDIKNIIREYWYNQKAIHSFDVLKKDDISMPAAGQLHVYMTEAKNLGIDELKKELKANPNMKMNTDKLQVRIGFKSPKLLSDLFASVFMNESLMVSVSNTLEKNDIVIEHTLAKNFSWRSPGNPAGEVKNLGRLVVLPKTNVLLTFTVTTSVIKNGSEETYQLGRAE